MSVDHINIRNRKGVESHTSPTEGLGTVNWKEVVKRKCRWGTDMPGLLTGRIERARRILKQEHFRAESEPQVIALYFKTARKGPIEPTR